MLFFFAQTPEPPGSQRPRHDPVQECGRLAGRHQDDPLPGQLPAGRHHNNGRRGPHHAQGSGNPRGHPCGSPEEDHQQHPDHEGTAQRKHVGGIPGLTPL